MAERDLVRAVPERYYDVIRRMQDLLGEIYLYVHWYDVSVRLTTEQKEAWADAIEAHSARLNAGNGEKPLRVPRWWRPDYAPPGHEHPAPTRRVTFEVTAYWRHGVVQGGFYGLQTSPDGGLSFSIPQGAVDENTIRDADPEILTEDDWAEIEGQVRGSAGSAATPWSGGSVGRRPRSRTAKPRRHPTARTTWARTNSDADCG